MGEDKGYVLPDIWIKKWDPAYNSVTTSGQWWEHLVGWRKISDVFPAAPGGSADISKRECPVEIVRAEGKYIVALMSDNGREYGKVLGMYIVFQVWYEPAHRYI
jgi:hypothetical protein